MGRKVFVLEAELAVRVVLENRHAVVVGDVDQRCRRSSDRVMPLGFWKFGSA